jgi:hypothetical protein
VKAPKPETPRQGRPYFYLDGRAYMAGLVNASRCRLDPLFTQRREIVSRLHDIRHTIRVRPPSLNISPASMLVPIIIRRNRR